MPIEDCSLGPGRIYTMDQSGVTVLEAPAWDLTWSTPLSADEEIDYNIETRTPLVQALEGYGYFINVDMFNSLAGEPGDFYVEYTANVQVQARRHRKKRINKKWLKRYGYKTVQKQVRMRCSEVRLTEDGDTVSISFDAKGE